MSLLLLSLLGCDEGTSVDGTTPNAHVLAEVMHTVDADPQGAADLCMTIEDRSGRAGCAWVVAERAGEAAPEVVVRMCDELLDYRRSECFFDLARATNKLEHCRETGAFIGDCERHIFLKSLPGWSPDAPLAPGDLEAPLRAALASNTLTIDGTIILREAYLESLSARHPVTASLCDPVVDDTDRGMCLFVVDELQVHYLTLAHANGNLGCGDSLPDHLQDLGDPHFDALVSTWRGDGRCTPEFEPPPVVMPSPRRQPPAARRRR